MPRTTYRLCCDCSAACWRSLFARCSRFNVLCSTLPPMTSALPAACARSLSSRSLASTPGDIRPRCFRRLRRLSRPRRSSSARLSGSGGEAGGGLAVVESVDGSLPGVCDVSATPISSSSSSVSAMSPRYAAAQQQTDHPQSVIKCHKLHGYSSGCQINILCQDVIS